MTTDGQESALAGCPRCGVEGVATASYCRACGATLPTAAADPRSVMVGGRAATGKDGAGGWYPPGGETGTRPRPWVIPTVLGALLVVAVVVVASVVVLRGDPSGSSAPSGRSTPAPTSPTVSTTDAPEPRRAFDGPPPMSIDPANVYIATLDTSEGRIVIRLHATQAPLAVNNFVFLARGRFYDGLTFHRVARDFVIQGGDPSGDGSGGPGYTVEGEVPADHYPAGSIAAAKAGAEPAGTFGSQFFVVTGASGTTLPNEYARFGTVTEGLDVARRIESYAPGSGDGAPTKRIIIRTVTIDESATGSSRG